MAMGGGALRIRSALATHARGEAVGLQKPAVFVEAVLAAAVRVMNEARWRLPHPDGLVQGFEDQALL